MTRLGRFVAVWGNGQHGRLGHGNEASELFPRIVQALVGTRIAAVAAGGAHTAIATGKGKIHYCYFILLLLLLLLHNLSLLLASCTF